MSTEVVNIASVVRLTKRTRKTIEAWIKNGRLGSVIVGKRTMVTVAELTRVFPQISPDQIAEELRKSSNSSSVSKSPETAGNFDTERVQFEDKIQSLNSRIAQLEEKISNQNDTILLLKEMNDFLRSQLAQALTIADRLSVPGITERSGATVKKNSGNVTNRPRDPITGQFIRSN